MLTGFDIDHFLDLDSAVPLPAPHPLPQIEEGQDEEPAVSWIDIIERGR